MLTMLAALAALVLALLVGLGFVPGSRGHAARVWCASVAIIAGVVLAGAAVATAVQPQAGSSVAASETDAGAASGTGQGSEQLAESDSADRPALPDGFSYVRDFAPGIEVELRYATTDNFTGQIVDGY